MSASEKYAAARAEADAVYLTEWRAAQDAPTLAAASAAAYAAERKRVDAWQAAAARYRAEQASSTTPVRMISLPGSVQFSPQVREHRTETYRTWRSPHPDMKHGWECLLCGEWGSGYETRAEAEDMGRALHPHWCHVVTGCSCKYPHITARMAARLGIRDEYPAHLAALLFRLAGGLRRPCPPCFDRHGTPHCDTAQAIVDARENAA